jgi:hypothetical protein
MGYHGSAANSCSSFADLVIKSIQQFKGTILIHADKYSSQGPRPGKK